MRIGGAEIAPALHGPMLYRPVLKSPTTKDDHAFNKLLDYSPIRDCIICQCPYTHQLAAIVYAKIYNTADTK